MTMQGYTKFSMSITIYFQKETGLKQEVFKLPKFDQNGVKKRQYIKMEKQKYKNIIKSK